MQSGKEFLAPPAADRKGAAGGRHILAVDRCDIAKIDDSLVINTEKTVRKVFFNLLKLCRKFFF